MRCPACKYEDSKVIDSRPTEDYSQIRRRRECFKCKYRFTTYERLGEKPLLVIKRNGSVEAFNPEKLYRGVLIACAKRPVEHEDIDALIKDIEDSLRLNNIFEINSHELGEKVLERLARIDQVAYIRFASVYKDFSNLSEFENALKGIS